jgi:hypothetical protein
MLKLVVPANIGETGRRRTFRQAGHSKDNTHPYKYWNPTTKHINETNPAFAGSDILQAALSQVSTSDIQARTPRKDVVFALLQTGVGLTRAESAANETLKSYGGLPVG